MLYKHSRIFNLFLVVFFTILTFTLLYPVWEVFVGSFMTLGDYARIPIKVLPIKPHLNNYRSRLRKNLLSPYEHSICNYFWNNTH